MSETDFHPYSLEVRESAQRPGNFEWLIRRNGKLLQRSDRLLPSEGRARHEGEKAVERAFSDALSDRR
jgi:hypothetical protein